MYNQKRANTVHFRLKNINNQFYTPQSNNFREAYTNQSPVYFSQYRYAEEEEPIPYMHQIHHYIKRRKKPIDYYEYVEKYDNSERYDRQKPSYYFSNYNSMKNSTEENNSFVKRGINTLKNPITKGINEKLYYNNENNNPKSVNNSQEKKIIGYFKKEYNRQSFQEEKYPPKYYRNNPLIRAVNS